MAFEERPQDDTAADDAAAEAPATERRLATARSMLHALNAHVVRAERDRAEASELRRDLGAARRRADALVKLAAVLAVACGLATSAICVFVTPASFAAFREGIAIQLIRTGRHDSLAKLHLRRGFAVVVERLLYETPMAAGAVLWPSSSPEEQQHHRPAGVAFLKLVLAVAAAAATRLACRDDAVALGAWLAAANVAFLGDDLGLREAELLFEAGAFALEVVLCLVALPAAWRLVRPPGRAHWARCRAALLAEANKKKVVASVASPSGRGGEHHAAARSEGVDDVDDVDDVHSDDAPRGGGAHAVHERSTLHRAFEALVAAQRRRLRVNPLGSRTALSLFVVAGLAWTLDTAIVHD